MRVSPAPAASQVATSGEIRRDASPPKKSAAPKTSALDSPMTTVITLKR